MNFKESIIKFLDENIDEFTYEEISNLLETPPESRLGDYALPCFSLAKTMRKAPNIIASEYKDKLETPEFLEKIDAISGYLNFFINKDQFINSVISDLKDNENYGSSNLGEGKTIVIDYASLNVAKPFHIGHFKNAVTGDSLYRTFKYLGYNCIGINHLGDFGTQFGKLIYAYKAWGNDEAIKERGIYELADLYVKFHEEADKDETLEDKGREWSYKIEQKDEEAMRLWNLFKDISIEYFNVVAEKLDLHFDHIIGESFYIDMVQDTVKLIEDKNLLVESNGAKIVELENIAPCIILRSDGASLYATRDIAAALYRQENYNFEKCIYITGSEQNLHFTQWFNVLKKMGYAWADGLVHIGHGMVRLEEGKLSTRKGNIITLEDAILEAKNRALDVMNASGRENLSNKELVAEQVGLGALAFNNLYNSSNKDVTFSWESSLRFDGETGPYLQYTHARVSSILRKAGELDYTKFDASILADESSFEVIKAISNFNNVLVSAANKYEPSFIARYLIDLAQKFNKFYNEYSIVVEDDAVRNTRCILTKGVKDVLKTGLSLICMAAPEEM